MINDIKLFRQYITGRYPTRHRIAFASALELLFADLSDHTLEAVFASMIEIVSSAFVFRK